MSIFILLAAIIAAVLIECRIYDRYWDDGVDARISFGTDRAVEGGVSELVEVVEHGGRLRLPWLSVKFQASKYLSLPKEDNSNITDSYYREDVFCIKPGERITRRLPITCEKRGIHSISAIDIISRDMFMVNRLVTNLPAHATITVFPKQVDVSDIVFDARRTMGEYITKKRTVEDPFVFRGLRDYVEGDDPRSVNWRASAKTDRLTVNQFESTTSLSASIWLNCESATGWFDEIVAEESIRIASSLAAELIDNGVPVSFCTNGCDCYTRAEEKRITAGCSQQHLDNINTSLARIELGLLPRRMIYAVDEMLAASVSEDFIVIISPDLDPRLLDKAASLREGGREVLWIVPVRRDDTRDLEELSVIPNHYIWRTKL